MRKNAIRLMLNSCYEMTFFNRKSQRTFTCQIVQNAKRHLKGAKTMQISGIGHSVIRGLGYHRTMVLRQHYRLSSWIAARAPP